MPKARLVFDGDNVYIGKDARIYGLKDDIASKIDEIPGVINSLDSTSTTDALSANMGRTLQDQINGLSGTGKFLSTWDCTTGLPGTNPQEDPYTYKVGDYYVVSVVGSTNYKPHGSTYTQGVPSTTVELENVGVNDKYYFDGADWVRIPDTAIQISIDSALSTTSTNAVENRAIANAVNAKQDIISDLSTIRNGAAAGATAIQPNDNISQLTNNVGYQTAGDVASAIAGKQDILTAGDGISITSNTVTNTKPGPAISGTAPANPTEGMLWYDSTNDVLKVYDGSAWQEVGSDAADINTKTFYISSTSDLTNAQAAYDWYAAGKTPILNHQNGIYLLSRGGSGQLQFVQAKGNKDEGATKTSFYHKMFVFTVSDGTVTSIDSTNYKDGTSYFLQTDRDYSTPYTPQYDGSPATKKYVDDSVADVIPSGSTAPQNPQEGDLWYDTVNHVLKVYDGTNWVEPGDNNVKVFTTTNSVVINGGDFKNDTTLVNTIVDINNWMTSSPSHIAYLYYVDSNDMHYKCPVIWCRSSSATKHIVYLISTGTSSTRFDHFHRAYVKLYMSGGTATVGEIVISEAPTYTAGNGINIDANNEISVDTTIIPTQADLAGKQDVLTAGDNIQISAQNVISATDTTYTAGEGIEIKSGDSYAAMRGPCSSGFHIPTISEWGQVNTIMNAFSFTTGNGWRLKLLLPFAGHRYIDSNVTDQGTSGHYWSVSAATTTQPRAMRLYITSSSRNVANQDPRNEGYLIRPFKDVSVAPDNSWTTLYDGSSIVAGAGIFHSAALGLISISGDGTNWITIADKNLGATTTYSDGATLSEANCGRYYQWGNNYGFAWTGTVTTSSTQVDASNYGPGNYYTSSTFIVTSGTDWSSVKNDNLWGGVTGVVTLQNAISSTQLSDAVFSSSWDGDTTHAPSKNAIYDVLGDVETLLANL